jgi:hypothetical protein
MFTAEAAFHINSSVIHYNCRIWEARQMNKLSEYVHDTPEVSMWCGVLHDHVLCFVERMLRITGDIFLDLLAIQLKVPRSV